MCRRGELTNEADPRHLAVAMVAAHQGGTLLTHVTGTPEPFRAAVDAAVDYVAIFAAPAQVSGEAEIGVTVPSWAVPATSDESAGWRAR